MMLPFGAGVTDRSWEIRHLFAGLAFPLGIGESDLPVFPEFEDKTPFQVSGIRLVERAALVMDFEDSEIVRLCDDGSNDVDLVFLLDTGEIVAETDDSQLYMHLRRYFDRTSAPWLGEHYY